MNQPFILVILWGFNPVNYTAMINGLLCVWNVEAVGLTCLLFGYQVTRFSDLIVCDVTSALVKMSAVAFPASG